MKGTFSVEVIDVMNIAWQYINIVQDVVLQDNYWH